MPSNEGGKRTLSLVLPIYNTDEKLLGNCFDSIASSWDDRLEVIAVDDGSEPAYGAWLQETVRALPFPCTLVHQGNGGQNAARSHGLGIASGDWVMFLDSDDLLDEVIGGLLDHLDATGADLCLIGLQMEFSEGEAYESTLPPKPEDVSKEAVLEHCPSLCGFVARRELLLEDRCSLIEGPRIAEDIASAFKIIATARSLTSYPFRYRYIMNPSGTTSKPHVDWMLDPIDAFRPLVEAWDGGYDELLAWTIILHVRLLGCERVLREVGLRDGRDLIAQLRAFSEPLYPGWRESPYFQRFVQRLYPWERVKMVPISKCRWRTFLITMNSVKALVGIKNKLFPSSASSVYVSLRRLLLKIGNGAS